MENVILGKAGSYIVAERQTLRYLQTDYNSQRDALVRRIQSRWPGVWTDFESSGYGMVLVDLVSWLNSTQAFLINRQASEQFVTTMTLRESAVRIGSLVGYQLKGPIPASVLCEVELQPPVAQVADVVIEAGTLIRTNDGVAFESVATTTIKAGQTKPSQQIALFSLTASGSGVIPSQLAIVAGSSIVDATDTTVDLQALLLPGQALRLIGYNGDVTDHTIDSIGSAPGAVSFNRMVLTTPILGNLGDVATCNGVVNENRMLFVQGQTVTDVFVTPAVDFPGYAVQLSNGPVIDGSVRVLVNGENWTQAVPPFVPDAADQVFFVRGLPNDATAVQFGNGEFGQSVPVQATVSIIYRIGGGTIGNIDPGQITTTVSGHVAASTTPVTLAVNNDTMGGQGGLDRETVAQARTNIPAYTRTNDRAVTLEDWQYLASSYTDPTYGTVSFARAFSNPGNSVLGTNLVQVYAWSSGPGGTLVPLPSPLKSALTSYLQSKAIGTDQVIVLNGTQTPVPVSLRFKSLPGFSLPSVTRQVQAVLTAFISQIRPGDTLIQSQLINALVDIQGIDYIDMATPTANLSPTTANELFIPPTDDSIYDVPLQFEGVLPGTDLDAVDVLNVYKAQLPASPLQSWSIRLFMGGIELTVFPDVLPGYARVVRNDVLSDEPGIRASTVNLATGMVRLVLKSSPTELTFKLRTIQGFSQSKVMNLFIGYVGSDTPSQRLEIRQALKAWANGLVTGGTAYLSEFLEVVQSRTNVRAIVEAIGGPGSVTHVSVGTSSNQDQTVSASEFEALSVGTVTINGSPN